MRINFFEALCQQTTNQTLFGICDDPPPAKKPAYINFDIINKPGWIAHVKNNSSHDITFTAIDNCIDIRRDNGDLESRCEGMLTYEDNIIFIELKDRFSKGWLGKAKDQITISIAIFSANHDLSVYTSKRVHIANAQRPFFQSNYQRIIDEIKTTCGFIAEVNTTIDIR